MTPLLLAVVSLVAAIGLWVAVTDAENPASLHDFGAAIEIVPINVPEGQAVASMSTSSVRVRVRAVDEVFARLSTSDFRATVDLREQAPEHYVFVRVVGRDDVEVVDVAPASIRVTLEPSMTRQVPVEPQLIGTPAQGFSVPGGGVQSLPAMVNVSGATSLVQQVAYASATVNLTGLRVSLQRQFSLVAKDSRGVDLRPLAIDPPNADIRVNIVQQEVTLGLTVIPQLQGSVAEGYNLVDFRAEPIFLPVSGPLELLQAVAYITTEPLDVSGLNADATRSVRLRLPSGLTTTRDAVTVRLKVAPAIGEQAVTVAPQMTNLGEGLRASLQTASVSVRLGGEIPLLRSLQPGAVRASVNLGGLQEGVHVLRPAISHPAGTQLLSVDPPQVVVVISR